MGTCETIFDFSKFSEPKHQNPSFLSFPPSLEFSFMPRISQLPVAALLSSIRGAQDRKSKQVSRKVSIAKIKFARKKSTFVGIIPALKRKVIVEVPETIDYHVVPKGFMCSAQPMDETYRTLGRQSLNLFYSRNLLTVETYSSL